jgi:hypothetical protein
MEDVLKMSLADKMMEALLYLYFKWKMFWKCHYLIMACKDGIIVGAKDGLGS